MLKSKVVLMVPHTERSHAQVRWSCLCRSLGLLSYSFCH